VLRKRAPNSTKGYWIAAASLSELGKAKEAEEILVRGIQRMPEDVGLQIEYAKLAERRLDWTEALARWRVIYDTYGHRAGISGAANILTELGRYDEAESLLNGVMYKFGNEITIWVTLARVAEHRKDWEEAERRWVAIRNRFPLDSMAYLYGLRPLYTLGRVAEAEKVLLDAMERIRDDPALLTEYAWIAHRRSDWAEAAQRWAALRERFPSQRVGYEQGAVALQALGLTEEAARLGAAQTA
jgi:predicted Zn-dependent protease